MIGIGHPPSEGIELPHKTLPRGDRCATNLLQNSIPTTSASCAHESTLVPVSRNIELKGHRTGLCRQVVGPGRPRTRPGTVLADRAHTTREIRGRLALRGIRAVIPGKRDRAATRRRKGSFRFAATATLPQSNTTHQPRCQHQENKPSASAGCVQCPAASSASSVRTVVARTTS